LLLCSNKKEFPPLAETGGQKSLQSSEKRKNAAAGGKKGGKKWRQAAKCAFCGAVWAI
jgi:hypothetical protein